MSESSSDVLAEMHKSTSGHAEVIQRYLEVAQANLHLTTRFLRAAVRENFGQSGECLPLLGTIDGRKNPTEVLQKIGAVMAKRDAIYKVILDENTLTIYLFGHPADTTPSPRTDRRGRKPAQG